MLDPEVFDDCGVPSGELLLRFVDSVVRTPLGYEPNRNELEAEVGLDGLTEAAATIAAFAGLVRVADATGIALDDGTMDFSQELRATSGLNKFAGAANSDLNRDSRTSRPSQTSVKGLFT